MQVLLKKSEFRQEMHCGICGQGFRLYWELNSPAERATIRNIVLGELVDHHSPEQGGDPTPSAHPFDLFRLPSWIGAPQFARPALLAHPRDASTSNSGIVFASHRTK